MKRTNRVETFRFGVHRTPNCLRTCDWGGSIHPFTCLFSEFPSHKGKDGVRHVLGLIRTELDYAMKLSGGWNVLIRSKSTSVLSQSDQSHFEDVRPLRTSDRRKNLWSEGIISLPNFDYFHFFVNMILLVFALFFLFGGWKERR